MIRVYRLLPLLVVLVLAMVFCGCSSSSDPNGDDPGPETEILSEAAIDQTGGELSGNGVTVTIPADVFGSQMQVTLLRDLLTDLDDHAGSDVYLIEGIPSDASGTIAIRVHLTGTDSQADLIGVQTLAGDDRSLGWEFHSANAEDGFLNTEIPVTTGAADSGGKSGSDHAGKETLTLRFAALANFRTDTIPATGDPEFLFSYPTDSATQAAQIQATLESTYDLYLDWGFRHELAENSTITLAPVTVYVNPFVSREPSQADVFAGIEFFGDAGNYHGSKRSIDIAGSVLVGGSMDELLLELSSNYFHLVAAMSDPELEELWLRDAVKVFAEQLILDDETITPSGFAGHETSALTGVHRPVSQAQQETSDYGSGMAALIKYVFDSESFETDEIAGVFTKISTGSDAVESLTNELGSSSYWWPDFVQNLVGGQLYDVAVDSFLNIAEETFVVADVGDTLAVYPGQYNDLSGKVYRIDLERDDFDDQESLRLNVEHEDDEGLPGLTAFVLTAGQLTLLASGESVIVNDLAELAGSGTDLLVIVTNADTGNYPEAGTSEITLHVSVSGSGIFNCTAAGVSLSLFDYEMVFDDQEECGINDPEERPGESFTMPPWGTQEGTWDGNVFTSSWDFLVPIGQDFEGARREWGELTITMNNEGTAVEAFDYERNRNYNLGNLYDKILLSYSGGGLTPYAESEHDYEFRTTGLTANEGVTLEYSEWQGQAPTCIFIMSEFSCLRNSYLNVYFVE